MIKDWIGNEQSVFTTHGASSHSEGERAEHDYYATEPRATELLLGVEAFTGSIWEPACGEGHISRVLENVGYEVFSSDIVYRGYGWEHEIDFLECVTPYADNIVTNPPYNKAKEFVEKALELIEDGFKVAMFLKLTFLESKGRKELFDKYPPKTIYVSRSRLNCAKNGDFTKRGSAVCYSWFVWEKGFYGNPEIKWIN